MRYKRVAVTNQFFLGIMVEGNSYNFQVTKGVPKNTRVISVHPDISRIGVVEVVVEHESFPDLKEGDEIPYTSLEMKKIG